MYRADDTDWTYCRVKLPLSCVWYEMALCSPSWFTARDSVVPRLIDPILYILPPRSTREGKVFSHVCLFSGGKGVGRSIFQDALGNAISWSYPPPSTSLTLCKTPSYPISREGPTRKDYFGRTNQQGRPAPQNICSNELGLVVMSYTSLAMIVLLAVQSFARILLHNAILVY